MDELAVEIRERLLRWYDDNKRDLPWRNAASPYAVWVSEIMAQQTRITVLLPYYERFMARFPTVFDLAEADEADVLKVWEGLGYYSRARYLHRAAQIIVAKWDGNLPKTWVELLSLPGVGEYTAGAIMSIAFGIPTPAVDGNVLRVVSRLTDSDEDVLQPKAKENATLFILAAIPTDRPGCFTQAMMELGALVCLPRTPACVACPLASLCRGKQSGRQTILPVRISNKEKRTIPLTVLVIQLPDGRILMRRRTEKLLNGLWTFYMAEGHLKEADIPELLRRMGCEVSSLRPLGEAKHIFTHLIWDMRGFFCQATISSAPAEESLLTPGEYALFTPAELHDLAIPTAIRKFNIF